MNYLTLKYSFFVTLLSISGQLIGQVPDLEIISNGYSIDTNKTIFDNEKQLTYFSLGIGVSPYRFLNQYSIDANILFPFQQNIYFKTGFIVFKTIKNNEPPNNSPHNFYLNFYVLYKFNFSRKINFLTGIGFAFFPLTGILYSVDIIANYQLNNFIYLGLELKQGLNFCEGCSKYYKYPYPSINLYLKL